MYDKRQVTDILLAEVGYREKATNAQLDDPTANAGSVNYTKYARDLAAVGYYNTSKSGAEWCAVFVNWGMFKAFGKEAALALACQPHVDNCGAGCGYAFDYYKRRGQLHTSAPQEGDQIFFWSADRKSKAHTGYVYAVDGECVYTVEGNVSGQVRRKQYRLDDASIAGYGRPDWEMACLPEEQAARPVLRRGASGKEVKTLQEALLASGCSCGDQGADGVFGQATESAVRKFQALYGLAADGVVGVKTWAKLEAVMETAHWTVTVAGLTEASAREIVRKYGGQMTEGASV